jgi:hypothetical protein
MLQEKCRDLMTLASMFTKTAKSRLNLQKKQRKAENEKSFAGENRRKLKKFINCQMEFVIS